MSNILWCVTTTWESGEHLYYVYFGFSIFKYLIFDCTNDQIYKIYYLGLLINSLLTLVISYFWIKIVKAETKRIKEKAPNKSYQSDPEHSCDLSKDFW